MLFRSLGTGVGMLMQNLVLAVQNVVPARQLGAASSNVAFFRTMGGAIGVSALGALLGNRIATLLPERLADAGIPVTALGGGSGDLPEIRLLPAAVRTVVESSYADGIAEAFLVAAPIALIALVAVVFLKEVPLSTKTAAQQLAAEAGAGDGVAGTGTAAQLAAANGPHPTEGAERETHEPPAAERTRESASAVAGVDPAAVRPGPLR